MKPFDDTLSEETSEEYEPLLTLLSHTSRKPFPLTSEEQAQALERVQERLSMFEEQMHGSQGEEIGMQEVESLPVAVRHRGRERTSARQGRILRFVNTFAAVLVIGAIIGASLLLFRHSSQFPGGKASQTASTPRAYTTTTVGPERLAFTIVTSAGGLEASLSIMAGPYFLRELVAVNVTLTNHTHTTYQVAGPLSFGPCGSALLVNYLPVGANTAHYTFPVYSIVSCKMSITQLKPGQIIAIREYIPLTDSGKVVLSEEAHFLVTKTTPNQGRLTTNGPSPLDGHWPSLHINVASQVPSDHVITLHRNGTKVFVHAPAAARSHLLYRYVVNCKDLSGSGSTESGNFIWTPTTTIIEGPVCGKNVQWTYAVSAAGYAIASGSYDS